MERVYMDTGDREPRRGAVATEVKEAPSTPVDEGTTDGPAAAAENDSLWVSSLEWFDSVVYWLVGLTFLAAALFSLVYGLYAVGDQVFTQVFAPAGFSPQALVKGGAGAQDVIALVSDLLLTLIIMEVLGTVVHHLRERETTLKPFLFIGIISATRGILAVGARLSVSTNGSISPDEFIRDMVELGVNAAVIIALGVTMKLIGRFLNEGAIPNRRKRKAGAGQAAATRLRVGAADTWTRPILALMVLIVLVALTLIGVVVTTGHF
jgi:uncharacterized membrane protein (DUF373 family)